MLSGNGTHAEPLTPPPCLAGLDFSDEERRQCLRAGGILRATLELGPDCNLRCAYCYAADRPPPGTLLTADECYDLIEQVAEAGARTVVVIGGGEPLMYIHWQSVIRFIRQRGLTPVLFTNGQLLDDEAVNLLDDARASVILKMDSLDHTTQDMLAGTRGAARAIAAAAARLLERGFASSSVSRLAVHAVICSENVATLSLLWRWARERHVVPLFQLVTKKGRAADGALSIARQDARDLFHELLGIDEREFGYTWSPQPPYAAVACDKLLYNLYVTYSGVVWPCVGVELALGDIRSQSVKEILCSPQMARVRNVMQNLHGECTACPRSGECYGCRGSAFAATGDLFASDPECWRHDESRVEEHT